MKTILTIIVTAAVMWITFSVVHGVREGAERVWVLSSVKASGRMAIGEIQKDMNGRRHELARAKTDALADTWQEFASGPDSCRGLGTGETREVFSKIDRSHTATNPEPGRWRQPLTRRAVKT